MSTLYDREDVLAHTGSSKLSRREKPGKVLHKLKYTGLRSGSDMKYKMLPGSRQK